jgi:hypothetical protein
MNFLGEGDMGTIRDDGPVGALGATTPRYAGIVLLAFFVTLLAGPYVL